jgi:hypothetical protein
VVAGPWHCVASWGYHGAARPSNWIVLSPQGNKSPEVYLHWGMGFQEPCMLLQAWENKACGQLEFCLWFPAGASGNTVLWCCC